MSKERQLEKIIEDHLPSINTGQESFASILEKHPKDADTLRPELEAALWLVKTRKGLDPRSGFVASSRKNLVKKISALPPQNAFQRILARYTPQRWVFNLAAPVVLLVLLALVMNSIVLTARLSIPGDPFYSTKLAIEDVRLAFTFDEQAKSSLYIQFSRERTTEFVELVLDGDFTQLPGAAARMETDLIATLHYLNRVSQTNPDLELPMVIDLRKMLVNEISMLKVLEDTSPSSAHAGIELAINAAQSGVMALH